MFQVFDVLTSSRLNENGTVRLFKSDGLTTILDGGASRPCIDGDVLSITPEGATIGRPNGTNGPWEQNHITSKGLLFSPSGNEGKQFLVGYVD